MVDQFELFPPGSGCEGGLPVNPIRDEFTIVRFAPMEAIADTTPVGPAVVPRDVINPKVIGEIERRFPSLPYDVFAKGGPPLVRRWDGVIDPPPEWSQPPEVDVVEIDDLGEFLSNRKVTLGGRNVEVDLTPAQVDELLESGTTVVEVSGRGDDRLIRIEAPALRSPARVSDVALPVGELSDFLATRTVTLEAETGRAQLTPENVQELATIGVSKVDVVVGRSHRDVYVSTGGAPAAVGDGARMWTRMPGEAVGTTSYAMSASRASVTVDMVGPSSIATLAADPVQLEVLVESQIFPKFELVLYLPYRQTWELLGYSRGELLNSVSLGPQEETTVEIFTWDRLKRMREEAFVFEQEGTLDVAFTDKVTTETIKEMTTTADWGWNVKGEVKVPLKYVDVNVSGGYDTRESVKTLHRGTQQVIGEAVRKASSRIKASRQTKVTESEEIGRETKVARKIKNPNMCKALNLDYFEVLATYRVTTRPALDEARLCVLTPNPIAEPIDQRFVLAYEGELRDILLSNTYLPGFDAARKLAAWERLCTYKCAPPCPCDRPTAASIPPPPPRAQEEAEAPPATQDPLQAARTNVEQAAIAVRQKIQAIENSSVSSPTHTKVKDQHTPAASMCDLANDVFGSHPESEWTEAKNRYHMWLYRKVVMETHIARFWAACQRFSASNSNAPEALKELVASADPQILDALNLLGLAFKYKVKALEMLAEFVKAFCWNLKPFLDNVAFDDGGFDAVFRQGRTALRDYDAAVTASTQPPAQTTPTSPPPESPQERETEEVAARGEPPAYTPKELAEADVDLKSLLAHLGHHESYYREAIWARLNPGDRYLFLSLFGDLLKQVDNEVIGFVGKKAALPFRLSRDEEVAEWFEQNVLENPGFAENPDATRVTLPTRGVLVESRLGACNGCEEFIVEHRDLDLRQKGAEVGLARERLAQERLETSRYRARLDQEPPMLDDPDPHQGNGAVRVVLEEPPGDEE